MSDTRQNIMNHAETFARTKGANGFSYADLAAKLGIRKASIHYHFPSKSELLQSLIQRYHERHLQALNGLDDLSGPHEKLVAFADLYKQGLKSDALCLCGMLTLDKHSLSIQLQEKLERFFYDTEAWLTTVFTDGHSNRKWQLRGTPEIEAKAFLALVQGAQLISRNASNGEEKFELIVGQQLDSYIV